MNIKVNKKKVIIFICIMAVLLTAASVLGISKVNTNKKPAPKKPEVTENTGKDDGNNNSEEEQGDWEVTEVEVEEEELTEEEIEKLEQAELEGKEPSSTDNTKWDSPYYVKVNRAANCVTIYEKDAAGAYTKPIKAMICSVGKNLEDTPTGVFRTKAKYTWRFLFGDQYGQYTTRIVGHILFHSVPYTEPAKDKLKTDYYNNLGVGDSMGCIRLTVADAKWIYDNCPLGTTVEIYDDINNPGPLGKPSAIKIEPSNPAAGWDPTDPDPANPWNTQNRTPIITGPQNMTIERGTKIDLNANVKATNFCGTPIPVQISGSVDVSRCGTYSVTYTATDALGNTAAVTITVNVVDKTAPTLTQIGDIVVDDKTTDITAKVLAGLEAVDGGQKLASSSITLDLRPLETVMAKKSYGYVACNAYATDANGNKSAVLQVKIKYESMDKTGPMFILLQSPVVAVDLSNEFTDAAKKQKILDAALSSVQYGTCFEVRDDVTPLEKIEITTQTSSEIDLSVNNWEVVVTLTAKDDSGNVSTLIVNVQLYLSV